MALNHQEVTDGNRLISQFMGSTIKINQEDVKDIPLAFLKLEDMKFHVAWKWLMPVVINIEEDLGYSITIENRTCRVMVDDNTFFESEAETKMEAVWKAVVDFLEWNKINS